LNFATQISIRDQLRADLEQARETTLWLFQQVPENFLKKRVHHFYSPIGWHFGHIAMTEEYWTTCRTMKKEPMDSNLSFIFANLPENPKDNRIGIPDRNAILRYLAETRKRTLNELEEADFESDDPLLHQGYAWAFALQHECQHQETICEMLQLIHRELQTPHSVEPLPWLTTIRQQMFKKISGGEFLAGSQEPYVYDNEREPHSVFVEPFQLSKYPVTAYEWALFIEDHGYDRPELWSKEGWQWKTDENVSLPEYWIATKLNEGHFAYCPIGVRAIHPDEPVCSISWFEAEAFARWQGKRLPTETEWEFAAQSSRPRSNGIFPWGIEQPTAKHACFGIKSMGPKPTNVHTMGRSVWEIEDLGGNVWEWTASLFLPYPGFKAFPYDGYSLEHMDGRHFVCRGGSWATAGPLLRRTFRNWYVPTYRQGILGLRLAE
jgi:iron(II)-dependent oxidoreductase